MDFQQINAARKEHGLKQGEIAKRIGVSSSRYSRIERGRRQATPEEAEKLRAVFAKVVLEPEPEEVSVIDVAAITKKVKAKKPQ